MRRVIILLFFAALIGTRFMVAPGVAWSDFMCVILLFYILANARQISVKNSVIIKSSLGYSIILIASGIINGTVANTVFLNFSRIFIEGTVVYMAISHALKSNKDFRCFSFLFFIYTIVFLVLSRSSIAASAEAYDSFQMLDIQGGRNGMAVANLLVLIMLSFLALFTKSRSRKFVIILYPFLVFNILFSTSRYAVISLVIYALFVLFLMRKELSLKTVVLYGLAIIGSVFVVSFLMSNISDSVMQYSSELLENKLRDNVDGGFAYRINDLNVAVIVNWLEDNPFYMYFFGDGISITHGVLSFTFCCTGVVGFLYFLISHIRISVVYWKKSMIGKYLAFIVLIFFFNDIVANSRFIIGVNNLLYMGMIAFIDAFESQSPLTS